MILGECPHDDCKHFTIRAIPDGVRLPAYSKETCDGCGRIVWVKYSRADPVAFTEADFHREHEIDEATREIKVRGETP